MRRIYFMLVVAVIIQAGLFGQHADTLRINECFSLANERSPLNRQKQISAEALIYKINNLSTNWLPAVGFNAQATYNSETVNLSDIMPGSKPSLPLDQYKVWADINQQLYDGGIIKAQKAFEKASYEAGIQQVESDLRGVKQQVNQVYFSLLLAGKSSAILQVTLDELGERKEIIEAGVNNGILLAENLLVLEAEKVLLQQKITELRHNQHQLFEVLSILLDSSLTEQVVIAEPVAPTGFNDPVNIPEYILFEKQKEMFQASQRLITASDLPKFFAFSQAAYGRPGYNAFSLKFHPFYSVGLGMKWNFLNYGDSRRQKKLFDIQKDMVDIKRETFDDQLNIRLQTENTNIEKYNELLGQDEQLMKLRKAITLTSLSKLNNGIITATDYLTDLHAELLAKLQYENHKMLKLQATYNYMLINGTL